jgi:hypothetical protein
MRDEMFGRMWVAHHQEFSNDLGRFLARAGAVIGSALKRLHEVEFDAPWKREVRRPGQA